MTTYAESISSERKSLMTRSENLDATEERLKKEIAENEEKLKQINLTRAVIEENFAMLERISNNAATCMIDLPTRTHESAQTIDQTIVKKINEYPGVIFSLAQIQQMIKPIEAKRGCLSGRLSVLISEKYIRRIGRNKFMTTRPVDETAKAKIVASVIRESKFEL